MQSTQNDLLAAIRALLIEMQTHSDSGEAQPISGTVIVYNLPDTTVGKFATISASSTNNTIVAAVPGKKIRVMQLNMTASADAIIKFQSGTGGADLTGPMNFYANALGLISASVAICTLPYSPLGWFETSAGVLLNLNRTAGTVAGMLVYTEV